MRLVRIGSVVINMDRVNSIELVNAEVAYLWYSAPVAPNGIENLQPDFTKLQGVDVATLERWLLINCEDITPAPAPAPASVEPDDGHDF